MKAKQGLILLMFSSLLLQTIYAQKSYDAEEILENVARRQRTLFPYYAEYNTHYGQHGIPDNSTFDFIIVGSGPSGSVIANRLSENPDWNILLLEIGSEPSIITDYPFLAGSLQFTDYAWAFRSEKQDGYCLGCPGGKLWFAQGRALGGASAINYMLYSRGNPSDYDKWADMGNLGWSYKDVLPYFLKSEDSGITTEDADYHRKGGYLSVSDDLYRTESANVFVKAAQQAGYRYVDYNGKTQTGVSYVQTTSKNGFRCSAEKAFLRPIRHRRNLKILTEARVVKILIDPENKIAHGVEYVTGRKCKRAIASKEVILCAGALNTPQLLMLSGIGPKGHLEKLGIPVLYDSPVGQKLYDHIAFAGLTFEVNSSITADQESAVANPNNYIRLITNGKGPLTSIGGIEALAYAKINTTGDDPQDLSPNVEFIFVSGGLKTDRGLIYRRTLSITNEIYNAVWRPLENKCVFQVFPVLTHPKSYGYIELKSKNPYHWPVIYHKYFSDPQNQDVSTFIAAIREIQRISKSPSLKQYGVSIVSTPIPGCQNNIFDSDGYWECALRHITPTLNDQIGTCKMGPANDAEAVVNHKLRVYGVQNLRVADSSVIPLPLAAHTQGPAYMIGEKASDLIKEDWKDRHSILDAADIRRHVKT